MARVGSPSGAAAARPSTTRSWGGWSSTIAPGKPFRPLYRTGHEYAAELSNRTVHAVTVHLRAPGAAGVVGHGLVLPCARGHDEVVSDAAAQRLDYALRLRVDGVTEVGAEAEVGGEARVVGRGPPQRSRRHHP